MSDRQPGSRLFIDVFTYAAARLALVAAVTAVIVGLGYLIGVAVPVVVALLFAIVIALPLGMWVFTPLRRRATASIAGVDERRRRDREQLRARLRGEAAVDEDHDGGAVDQAGGGAVDRAGGGAVDRAGGGDADGDVAPRS